MTCSWQTCAKLWFRTSKKGSRRDVGHDLQNQHSFILTNKLWTSISSSQVPSPCHSTQPWFSLVDSQGSEAKALSSLSTTGPLSPSYGGDPPWDGIWYPDVPGTLYWNRPNEFSSATSFSSEYSFPGYACHIHAASSRYGALDLNWSSVLMRCCHPVF